MAFKIGEKYKCIKAPNGNFTEGKLYDLECNYAGQAWLRGNDGLKYTSEQCTVGHRLNTTGLQFEKVEEDLVNPDATIEEPTVYTKTEVIRQITNAYQHFNTDAERLAYLKGYFAK